MPDDIRDCFRQILARLLEPGNSHCGMLREIFCQRFSELTYCVIRHSESA
jgi:hypothetical protein